VVDIEEDEVESSLAVSQVLMKDYFELRHFYGKAKIRIQPGLQVGIYDLALNLTDKHETDQLSRIFDLKIHIIEPSKPSEAALAESEETKGGSYKLKPTFKL